MSLTLVTSDDPPVRLEASRLVLAAGSKVFADMFELPRLKEHPKQAETGGEEGCVVLAEPKKVVAALIAMFEGKAVGVLDNTTWEALARAGDKYDSPVVKQYVERRIWELEAKDQHPLHSYVLATYCASEELLERTALRAVDSAGSMSDDCGASREWQLRLLNFKALRKAALLDALVSAATSIAWTPWACRGSCKVDHCDPYRAVTRVLLDALRWANVGSSNTDGTFPRLAETLDGCVCYRRQASNVFSQATTLWLQRVPSFKQTY